jgi:hypothetical protein
MAPLRNFRLGLVHFWLVQLVMSLDHCPDGTLPLCRLQTGSLCPDESQPQCLNSEKNPTVNTTCPTLPAQHPVILIQTGAIPQQHQLASSRILEQQVLARLVHVGPVTKRRDMRAMISPNNGDFRLKGRIIAFGSQRMLNAMSYAMSPLESQVAAR